ncbi:MAG TPA: hypothetical protein PLS34_09600 [Gammaproteobacteria bacterium]|nr:hypothetical protein [Gammaproteobacteria bacterium]
MRSTELDNLVRIGRLKPEPPSERELAGLLASARVRLEDAGQASLSFDSRFDLAYNASHSLALYALRRLGYRSDHRYLAFQALPHSTGLPPEVWRVLAKAHQQRNRAEYEGHLERDERLLADLITAAKRLSDVVSALPPVDEQNA